MDQMTKSNVKRAAYLNSFDPVTGIFGANSPHL